jgi:hypothetical protein
VARGSLLRTQAKAEQNDLLSVRQTFRVFLLQFRCPP